MVVGVLVASPLGACTGVADGAPTLEAVRRDSAGVEIVLNPASESAVPAFAFLDSTPSLRIGSLNSPREEQFGSVDDVLPLTDGGVAVLDRQAGEIRLFDSQGGYRTSLGSKGQGPGELQNPSVLAVLPGDTLAVYDVRLGRITRFGPDGALGRITTLATDRGRTVAASFLPDGRLVGQSPWLAPNRALPGPESTFVRDTVVLTLFATDGAVDDTIEVLPGRENIQSIVVGEGSVSVMKRPLVFGRTNLFTAHPEGIWSSTNDRFELRLREAAGGRLMRIVRAPGLESPATNELAQAIYERALAGAETQDDRRASETWYELSPRPETLPAYDRIIVDDQARLWVRSWSALEPATRWWVFTGAGDLLGPVESPSGTTIMSVRCGWVWGVEQDELGVSYVVRYALRGVGDC